MKESEKIPYDLRSFKFKRKKYLDIDSYNEGYEQALSTQKQEFEKMIDEPFKLDEIEFQGKNLSKNEQIKLASFLILYKGELKSKLKEMK